MYDDGCSSDSAGTEEHGQEAEQRALLGAQIRRSLARPAVDNQLLLQKQVFGDHGAVSAWPDQFGQDSEQVKYQ